MPSLRLHAVFSLDLAIVLLVVIFVSSTFTFAQELATARTLASFRSLIPATCIVVRGGIPARVPSADVVVGDVVQLETGGRVPAGECGVDEAQGAGSSTVCALVGRVCTSWAPPPSRC